MWYLGLVIGLLVGAAMGWGGFSLVLAGVVAFVFHKIFSGKTVTAPTTITSDQTHRPEPVAASPEAGEHEAFVDLDMLQRRVFELELRIQALERSGGVAGTSPVAATPVPASAPVVAASVLPSTPTWKPLPAQPSSVAAPAVRVSVPAVPESPLTPASTASATAVQSDDQTQALSPRAAPLPQASRPPPPPPAPVVPWRDRLPEPIAKLIFGGNTLVKLGVLILFLGLSFLLRYTAERVTVPIELRYASVALVGAGLLMLGWLLRLKRAGYALILQGAGIGVFYLTTLAAMKLSGLLPVEAGFAFLFAVAVLAAALAVLQNAPMLAIVAVIEGFAAPVLASTGQNRPVGLFSYLLVLDIGIVLMAWFRPWRVLNLIGFAGTFTLAAAWAQHSYTPDQFSIVEPFLIMFFLLFTAVGLLFARRTLADAHLDASRNLAGRAAETLRLVGRVDSALAFGVPMAAFGMQYLLMRPWEFGAAFSAMAMAAFYLLLARIVFATQARGLALLAEAYAIVGVIFGTLAIPLGLEGQWTGAAWAVEAAGMYWLGVRQARPYARAFSFLVLLGAAFKLLQDTRIESMFDHPLIAGSTLGPLLLAGGAFAMWRMHCRGKLDQGTGWEPLAGTVLPWLAMASLTLLQWQWWTPPWAAAATAALASATFAAAMRFSLRPLSSVSYAMQALAVAGFVSTLHRSDTERALASGWQGAAAAGVISLSILATTAWTMAQARRAALARGVAPDWSMANIAAVLTGTGLLHLAMLFQLSLPQAALIWPLTATVVLWVALRMAHGPLAALAAVLHVISGVLLLTHPVHSNLLPAFAHTGFWTAIVLGMTALIAGAWISDEARPRVAETAALKKRWVNGWCALGLWLWAPVIVGLGWCLLALLGESTDVLTRQNLASCIPAACIAIVLCTSWLAATFAGRRYWLQLGQASAATLPGLVLIAVHASMASGAALYIPSAALGWLVWPLAAVWHLRLLRLQKPWLTTGTLQGLHVTGFWFFVLLAARECQWLLAGSGDDWSSWPLLGWVVAPALSLWALRSPLLLRRWPLAQYRSTYLEVAALPLAIYLLGWAWVTNARSAGDASPLPYVPLLNPLELGNWLVLLALMLWWRALPGSSTVRPPARVAQGIAGLTALALLTGMVLRACHHFAGVPWIFDELHGSRLVQAALSITWALCGVLAMVLGNKRELRVLWIAGAALLGMVVVKLFFVELADRGGLFRIVSFIGVGALLLLVGYFAPVPPPKTKAMPSGEGGTA